MPSADCNLLPARVLLLLFNCPTCVPACLQTPSSTLYYEPIDLPLPEYENLLSFKVRECGAAEWVEYLCAAGLAAAEPLQPREGE
jgi:hypothetical protein